MWGQANLLGEPRLTKIPFVILLLKVGFYVLLTRPPLNIFKTYFVRLACVKHAASVHSKPVINSPLFFSFVLNIPLVFN
uniref:Uncharacterized protein n=1 Tax=Haematococcus lacustris TaxID=44745 RepID=A0A2K9YRK7_HAELA|nr:hypothetical protein SG3EUKT974678.1 [Haematococcus lacustris]AUW36443.1 hypothetical protein SG3EUKT974678.1 [Haematococcus lacustris]